MGKAVLKEDAQQEKACEKGAWQERAHFRWVHSEHLYVHGPMQCSISPCSLERHWCFGAVLALRHGMSALMRNPDLYPWVS